MNLDRYEKIDGREALKRLVCGENIFDDIGSTYFIEAETNQLTYRLSNGETFVSLYNLTEMLPKDWYIPKPFDVRQAMLDRPNEWVGACKSALGTWYKVGFDSAYMTTIVTTFDQKVEATHDTDGVRPIFVDHSTYFGRDDTTISLLDSCIPIEEVPEEATQ